MSVASEFVNYSAEKLALYLSRIETCLDKLTTEQIWARQSENENAVGNLILHLEGNTRQWIIGGVGGQPDVRDRPAEFHARAGASCAELKGKLRATVEEAIHVIRGVLDDGLTTRIKPQGQDVSVLEAIFQVVQHFAGHTFQVILLTKLFTHEDLGFYAYLNQPVGKKAASQSTAP